MSLVDDLASKKNKLDITDAGWEQFVKDHLDLIVTNSTKRTLLLSDTKKFDYKPIYLLAELGISREYAWIVRLINKWSSDRLVTNITSILLPSTDYIKSLYQSYLTTINKDSEELVLKFR